MNVALIGSVSSSWHALRGLYAGGVEVVGVCGLDERFAGTVSDYRSLRELAGQHGTPYLAFDRVADPAVREFLNARRPDLLFVIGLSQIVPASVRDVARFGAVGFHPTPLPRGRGRAPVAWTILLGEPAAANLFFLTDEPDAGDLIAQRPVEVRPDDYAADLIDRTNLVLEQMVTDLAPAIREGRLEWRPQDHSKATWYAKRTPADGLIDWSRPAEAVYRLIRAASHPYPGAFTYHHGEKLIVWRAEPQRPARHVGLPGQIVDIAERGLLVCCGDGGLLWLTETERTCASDKPRAFRAGDRLGLDPVLELAHLKARLDEIERRLAVESPPASDRAGEP